MAIVNVVRTQRRKMMSDPKSPMLHTLKQKPGEAKTYNLKRLASEIETVGALSSEDVQHVLQSCVRSMKTILRDGNRVKIDGLGTFYITFRCPGVATEKECTVKSIQRVNIRFKVSDTMRLVNDSTATTRGGDNNVEFSLIKLEEKTTPPVPPVPPADDEEDPIVPPAGDDEEDPIVDPTL